MSGPLAVALGGVGELSVVSHGPPVLEGVVWLEAGPLADPQSVVGPGPSEVVTVVGASRAPARVATSVVSNDASDWVMFPCETPFAMAVSMLPRSEAIC